MNTSDFNYELPESLIAQEPIKDRDTCRLLCMDRKNGSIMHRHFSEVGDLLKPGDLLVLNDTRVIPARVLCCRPSGGNVELLFTERISATLWKALAKPGRRLKAGAQLFIRDEISSPELIVQDVTEDGARIIAVNEPGSLDTIIERYGRVPLPPYIKRPDIADDRESYQTVYARKNGAVAAPTAGLHFTAKLLDSLQQHGIGIAYLTLHVGVGTFLPVKVDDPQEHVMHEEEFILPAETAEAVLRTRQAGGRIVAVGTTVVRVLEHCAGPNGELVASAGRTRLKILPPYEFKVVDALITNFHLPRSTLLMLVSAFASREMILKAYSEAISLQYRFFSYGDAMFIY